MADKNVYLDFLAEYDLEESDVSPVVAKNRKEKADQVLSEVLPSLLANRKRLSPRENELLDALLQGLQYYESNTNRIVEKMHSELLEELNSVNFAL